jgi:hypothetical protein
LATDGNGFLRQVTICGALLVAAYAGLFCILQSPPLWYALRPDPARSLGPELFRPVNEGFPDLWVNLEQTDPFALIMLPLYAGVLALATLPLAYLLWRLGRGVTFRPGDRGPLLRRVFGATAGVMLVLFFARGLLSTDMYSYIWYARIWVVHGASPFTQPPTAFPPDPDGAIHWAGWQNETSVYGPAWLILSAGAYKVGEAFGGSFAAQVIVFRLLADSAHLLNAWLVWSVAGMIFARYGSKRRRAPDVRWRSIEGRPRRWLGPSRSAAGGNRLAWQMGALLFYAWNPLLLIEFASSGHNDVVMLTWVLLAMWLHLKGWWPLAALSLGLAVLTKLPAIIFVPGYLWLLLWERRRAGEPLSRWLLPGVVRAAGAVGVIAAAAVALYAPFWEGTRTLGALTSGPANRLFRHSIASDLWWNAPDLSIKLLGVRSGQEEFTEAMWRTLDGSLRYVLLGLFAAAAVALTWRARSFVKMVWAWGWVAVAAVMTQAWFWPWYVSWATVPAALSGSRRLRTATLIFSLSGLLLYVEEQVLAKHWRLFVDWSGVFMVLPTLLYLLVSWLMGNRRRLHAQPRRKSRRSMPGMASEPEPLR